MGKFREAEEILRKDKKTISITGALGVVLLAQCKYQEAERVLGTVISVGGTDFEHQKALAYHNLSVLYRKRGEISRSDNARKKALVISGGDASSWPLSRPIYPIWLGNP